MCYVLQTLFWSGTEAHMVLASYNMHLRLLPEYNANWAVLNKNELLSCDPPSILSHLCPCQPTIISEWLRANLTHYRETACIEQQEKAKVSFKYCFYAPLFMVFTLWLPSKALVFWFQRDNCTARVQHFAIIYNMNLIKMQWRACIGFPFLCRFTAAVQMS